MKPSKKNKADLSSGPKIRVSDSVDFFNSDLVAWVVLDEKGRILDINKAGSDFFDLSAVELTGREFATLLASGSLVSECRSRLTTIIETGIRDKFSCQLIQQDGKIRFVLVDTMRVTDKGGKLKYLLSTITDISEEKRQTESLEISLTREKKINEFKSQFITIVLHEFRTPLTTILSSAELMLKYNKAEEEDKRQRHFRNISSAVSRQKEILMDFLSARKIEMQEIENSPGPFNIVAFTEDLIKEVKTFNGVHHLKYTHSGNSMEVFLDKQLLKTCLTNVIINAYKYSSEGSRIDVLTEVNNPGNVIVKVEDHGMGIPEDDQKNIFEPFFRAKNVSHISGTGLGLNIVKELITVMKGQILFESEEHKGTVFTLVFSNGSEN